jgi:hypothetical protein
MVQTGIGVVVTGDEMLTVWVVDADSPDADFSV